MSILSGIRRLLSNRVVRLSEPFSYGRYWAYIFAADDACERRLFETKAQAVEHLAITRSGLATGGPFISVQKLSLDRTDEFENYQDVWYSSLTRK